MSTPAQMKSIQCPHCRFSGTLVKAGRNRTGTQRYLCRACGRSCTPEPKSAGHDEAKRKAALSCYAACMGVRDSARCAGVSPQTVVNWIKAAVAEAEAEREDGTLEPGSLLSHVLARRGMDLYQKALDEVDAKWRRRRRSKRHF